MSLLPWCVYMQSKHTKTQSKWVFVVRLRLEKGEPQLLGFAVQVSPPLLKSLRAACLIFPIRQQ